MIIFKTLVYAYIIYCESKSESFLGKLAVGETIDYRSHDISRIFGKNQFSFNPGRMYPDNLFEIPDCILAGFLSANGLLLTGKVKSHFNSNGKIPKDCKFVVKYGKLDFYMEKNK